MDIEPTLHILPSPDAMMSETDDNTPEMNINTPRNVALTQTSPFVRVERLLRVDHGVDGDTKEMIPILSLAVSPVDPTLLVTGGNDGSVRLWTLPSNQSTPDPTCDLQHPATRGRQITTLLGHSGQVNAVRFSPSGDLLASCSADTTVRVYARTGSNWKLSHCLRFHSLDVTDIAWFSDSVLVSASADRNAVIWDAVTGGRVQTLYSDRAHCPKGVSVDPKGEYLCVLFDEGLVDVYRRNSDGRFRLSRHVDLGKDDAKNNCQKAFKTSFYARRGCWTPSGDQILLPLGARSRSGPCGILYDRLNLLEPTPGERLLASKIFSGHPSRIVVVSIRPSGLLRLNENDNETYYISAMVSVDGVLSLWSSNSEKPIAVVANIAGPLSVCTDAAWSGNVLLLSMSDGSVMNVEFYNIGKPQQQQQVVVPIGAPLKTAGAPTPTLMGSGGSYDVKSAQVEVRIGGKRKIQPVVQSDTFPSNSHPVHIEKSPIEDHAASIKAEVASSTVDGLSLSAKNDKYQLTYKIVAAGSTTTLFAGRGLITALTHTPTSLVMGMFSNDKFCTDLAFKNLAGEYSIAQRVLVEEPVKLLRVVEDEYIGIVVGKSSVHVWHVDGGSGSVKSVHGKIPIQNLFDNDEIVGIDIVESVPVLTLKSGTTVTFNPALALWNICWN